MELKSKHKTIRKLLSCFFKGLLLMAPFYLTLIVIGSTVQKIDNFVNSSIPGLGLAILLVLSTLIGYLSSITVLKSLFDGIESLIKRLPLINIIYSSSKDLFEAFIGEKKVFDNPVLVKCNETDNVCRIGFVTNSDLTSINMPEMVAVYFPNSYSFSGEIVIVPRPSVKAIEVSSAEITKFVLSGGISEVSKRESNKTIL